VAHPAIISPQLAYRMTDLMEVVARGTARRPGVGRPTASKTGTSTGHRDAWFIGFTERIGGCGSARRLPRSASKPPAA
jgi:membrane peptidoglycan carboxypeptidase